MSFLSHRYIAPDMIEERTYQRNIANDCLKENTLVIIPTGLGKTIIAMIVAAHILEKGKKVLLNSTKSSIKKLKNCIRD